MSCVTHALPIHFFKIIAECNLENEELMIPKRFIKKYGRELSDSIVLKVPNGTEWKVHLKNRNGDIWFEGGFQKFANFYSLKHGYFMVFKYEGGSLFHVLIFDKSALEINYDGEGTSKHYEGIAEINAYADIPNDREERSIPRKRKKSNTLDDTQQRVSGNGRRGLPNTKNGSKTEATKKESLEDMKNRALERAEKFQAELTNPSFIRPLTPSYVQNDYLRIPSDFSRKYLEGSEGPATIGVGVDRNWSVMLRFNDSDSRRGTIIMSNGWKPFYQEYNLEDGDVCVFQKTDSTPAVSFKVHIFRVREEPSSEQSTGYEHEENQLDNNESGNVCNVQFGERISRRSCPKSDVLEDSDSSNKFKVTIRERYLKGSVPCISLKFMKRHRRCHGKYVELQVGEQLHRVKIIYYPYKCGIGKFSAGWSKFVRMQTEGWRYLLV